MPDLSGMTPNQVVDTLTPPGLPEATGASKYYTDATKV